MTDSERWHTVRQRMETCRSCRHCKNDICGKLWNNVWGNGCYNIARNCKDNWNGADCALHEARKPTLLSRLRKGLGLG